VETAARRLVTKFVVPEYASTVQLCPCDADGAATCFAASLERTGAAERACQRLSV
jgi:hypothetical protein